MSVISIWFAFVVVNVEVCQGADLWKFFLQLLSLWGAGAGGGIPGCATGAEPATGSGPKDGGGNVVTSGGHFEEGSEDRVIGVVSAVFELAAKAFAEGFGSDAQMFGDMVLRDAVTGHGPDCVLLLGSRGEWLPAGRFGFFGDFVGSFLHDCEFLFPLSG